jgi:hypothetical protein
VSAPGVYPTNVADLFTPLVPSDVERRRTIAARAAGYRPTPPKRRSGLVKLRPGPIVQRPEVDADVCPMPVGEGGAL